MASDTCSRRASEHNIHKLSVSFTWASALGQLVWSTTLSTAVDEHRSACAPPIGPEPGRRCDRLPCFVRRGKQRAGSGLPYPRNHLLCSERYTVPNRCASASRLERGADCAYHVRECPDPCDRAPAARDTNVHGSGRGRKWMNETHLSTERTQTGQD